MIHSTRACNAGTRLYFQHFAVGELDEFDCVTLHFVGLTE